MITQVRGRRRVGGVALATMSLLLVMSPAEAAKQPVRTTVSAHLNPATALVKSTVLVAGTTSPGVGSLTLQRLVGKAWTTVAHQKSTAKGGFSFAVRPKATATWQLRVSRAATKATKASVSATLHLHVVTTAYVVAASAPAVTSPAPVIVSGAIAPKATGSVQLQQLTGRVWATLASAKVTAGSTFVLSAALPTGDHRLRVVKTFSKTVAAGTSAAMSVSVNAAQTPPAVATMALPAGTAGFAYSTTLAASGGTAPYAWSASGLPAGLAISRTGTLSGTPATPGVSQVTLVVADSAGRSGSATLSLTVVAASGHAWGWGINDQGELGTGTLSTDSLVLVPVTGLTSVAAITGGESSGYAVGSDGSAWAWGDNTYGELGNNSTTASTVPVRVTGLTGATAIGAGRNSADALRADGTVWAWGDNSSGELGNNSTVQSNVPVQVTGLASVTSIAVAEFGGYALRSDGTVWAWGDNGVGELGPGSALPYSAVPVQVTGLGRVVAIGAANYAGYALAADGKVWAWGNGAVGELGNNTTTNSATPVQVSGLTAITAIAGGADTGYALRTDGTVWAWGYNHVGELGNGGATNSPVPVQVSGLTGVTAIAGGESSGYALKAGGTVWAWGANTYGQLGDNSTTSRATPGQVSGLTGVVAIGSGSVSSCGYAIEAG